MKRVSIITSLFFCLIALNYCTAFKKQIVKPVVIALPDTNFLAILNPSTLYSKYLNHATVNQYARLFMRGFKKEAAITKNITLTYNEANADFILKLKSLTLTETERMETITDPKSPYNGKQVELNTMDCSAVLEIVDAKNRSKKLNNCTNSKNRSEQFTNNRNLDDLINGKNKDKTYRTKLLSDSICSTLSEDVGRRIWTPITRRISGDLTQYFTLN